MKITDKVLEDYCTDFCAHCYDSVKYITSEELSAKYFQRQTTEDILDYVYSQSYHDEVYITQAMIECAVRAGLADEWMEAGEDYEELWRKISRTLRKQIRDEKNAGAAQKPEE